MGQKADRREQIYRKNGDVTWGRRLTTESKSIGKVGTSHGAEGRPQSRGEGADAGEQRKWTEKAAEKVAEEVTQRRQQREQSREAAEGKGQG